MNPQCVLGIDVGSSSTKAGLFSRDGAAVDSASRAYPTDVSRPGCAEQDAEAWWRAAVESIGELMARNPRAEVAGVGASGHISSLTFVNVAGVPLRPALGFQDRRAIAEVDELGRRFSRAELAGYLGIDLPPAATWPLPRLLWFQKHEPETLDRAFRAIQAKDFVNFRLTGELASDASSNRGMIDLANGQAPAALFARLNLPARLLPALREPHEAIGTLRPEAARETGLTEGIPVVAGWNDLNASVLGSGCAHHGDLFSITGTSEHLGGVTDSVVERRSAALVAAPFLPGKQLLYGVTTCGGRSLDWFLRAFGGPRDALLARAAEVPPGSEGLFFLPYLEGERAPIWDAAARGAFIDIRSGHREEHFVRAILEGVAFGLRQILELLPAELQSGSGALAISGGAAQSALWNQIRASVLGRTLTVSAHPHTGTVGAAMLAAVGCGWYPTRESAAHCMSRRARSFAPDGAEMYAESYARFCELYPALKNWFHHGVTENTEEAQRKAHEKNSSV